MFLVPLVVFLGVKFGFQKSCLCKRNDKYEVWALLKLTINTVNLMQASQLSNFISDNSTN